MKYFKDGISLSYWSIMFNKKYFDTSVFKNAFSGLGTEKTKRKKFLILWAKINIVTKIYEAKTCQVDHSKINFLQNFVTQRNDFFK